MIDFTKLNQEKATPMPQNTHISQGGKFSVNIVCARGNRKSITLTKKLAEQLNLGSTVFVTIYGDDGLIVLSSTAINEYSAECKFSNTKDYIVYNAQLVHFIADTFDLDYTSRTSMSFSEVSFGVINNVQSAVVMIKNATAAPKTNIIEGQVSIYDNYDINNA